MSNKKASFESGRINIGWERPFIRPISKLGEMTTPTTLSASTPERHVSNISEMRGKFIQKKD